MSFHWRPDLWNSHQRCKLVDHQDLYSNHHREDYDHHIVFNGIVFISNIRCAQMWPKPSAAQFRKPSKSTPLKTSWCHFISSCKDRLIVTMMNKTLIVLTRVNYQRISGRRKVAQRWTSRSAHRTTRTCAGITKLRSDRFQEEIHWNMWFDRFSELTNSQVDECETVYDEECKKVPFHQCKTVKVPLSCWASHSWTVLRWLWQQRWKHNVAGEGLSPHVWVPAQVRRPQRGVQIRW